MEEKLTHFDEKGNAIMVDVTEKKITSRNGHYPASIMLMKCHEGGWRNGCQGPCKLSDYAAKTQERHPDYRSSKDH